ncbi:hypothetical protein EJB05_18456, partial [Eragrostis curvula]
MNKAHSLTSKSGSDEAIEEPTCHRQKLGDGTTAAVDSWKVTAPPSPWPEAGGLCTPWDFEMALRLFRTKVQMFRHQIGRSVTYSTAQPKGVTVGIDFGCKNSRVAIVDSLIPQVLYGEISRFIPSYVTLTRLNSFVPYKWGLQHLDRVGKRFAVGEVAKRKMWIEPSDAIYNIKKMIGKRSDESSIQEMKSRVHFSIVEGPGGEACVEIHGMQFSPVEITNVILSKLRDVVLMHQCHGELQVVISVPAFFDKQQKEDILSAGNSAGLKILQLIDEPIAAALSGKTIENGTVVVFGMGAGSYSVSILHVSPDTNIEIVTQSSDPSVGGDQFDNILVDYLVDQITQLHSVDIRGDKYAMMMLTEVAEQSKVELSYKSEFTVSIPAFPISAQGPVDLKITISRMQFEELVGNLIGQIKMKCQRILEDAKMSVKDIDEVILFGGMTRVPKIQKIVSEVFGKYQNKRMIPEEAVVIGSALQAARIVENEQEVSEAMIPLSIGIKSEEGTFIRVIPRHTTVPAKRTVKIPLWGGDGESARISIYFGEHVMVEHNLWLGEVEVVNYQSSYQHCSDIELTVEVDTDFVVKVSAINSDDQGISELMPFQAFRIKEENRCKKKVAEAVKKALLDWRMHQKGNDTWLRNLARHIMNTLGDALSSRKDELPGDLCEDAVNALSDLQKSLYGDADVLKDKMLAAMKVESFLLSWKPPSESLDSDSDS